MDLSSVFTVFSPALGEMGREGEEEARARRRTGRRERRGFITKHMARR